MQEEPSQDLLDRVLDAIRSYLSRHAFSCGKFMLKSCPTLELWRKWSFRQSRCAYASIEP